jgi:hypothetical protein
MPRRFAVTGRRMEALLRLPSDRTELLKHYTLSDEDLGHIRKRRRPHNKFGFAVQLCALRQPGRLLAAGELIPAEITEFVGAQLGLNTDALAPYAVREETRHEHLAALRKLYGFRSFTGGVARDLRNWASHEAETAASGEELVVSFVERCRQSLVILPAATTIERLCAGALVNAERVIETRIADRLPPEIRSQLLELLNETVDGRATRFVWLRQFEPGANSAAANQLLDRLDYLRRIKLSSDLFDGIPPHRVTRLRRQGERYYADGMRDLPNDRRLAILAICAWEWRAVLADAIIETHDRIVGKLWRSAQRICDARTAAVKDAVHDTLKSFAEFGGALLDARDDGEPLDTVIETKPGWEKLRSLVAAAMGLTGTLSDDPLSHVVDGWHRFRRYAPRMLNALKIHAAPASAPLLAAVEVLRGADDPLSLDFLRPGSKWRRHLRARPEGNPRLWEIAVLFHVRDAFRSGDFWLEHSRRHGDLRHVLLPAPTVMERARLAVPERPEEWLMDRRDRLGARLKELGKAARAGTIPDGAIENGELHIEKLESTAPDGVEDLVLDLYGRLPRTRITDLLLEVDNATGFSEAFVHLRTGAPCTDRIGLMNVVLAEGINLGLRKMAKPQARTASGN